MDRLFDGRLYTPSLNAYLPLEQGLHLQLVLLRFLPLGGWSPSGMGYCSHNLLGYLVSLLLILIPCRPYLQLGLDRCFPLALDVVGQPHGTN